MYRLLLVVGAALVGAAIWRRRELRNDADRASAAISDAANAARARVNRSSDTTADAVEDAVEQAEDAVSDAADAVSEAAENASA
jgi:hypothetical protein